MIKPRKEKIAEALGDQPRDAYTKEFNSPETRERIRQRVEELWCDGNRCMELRIGKFQYCLVLIGNYLTDPKYFPTETESAAWEEALLWLTEEVR